VFNSIETAVESYIGGGTFLVTAGNDQLSALIDVGEGFREHFADFGFTPVESQIDEQRGADAFVEGHEFSVDVLRVFFQIESFAAIFDCDLVEQNCVYAAANAEGECANLRGVGGIEITHNSIGICDSGAGFAVCEKNQSSGAAFRIVE
jgi:hypothetical protein